jgi:hypothetical protein
VRARSLRLFICDVFGHRVPRRRRPFFFTERYQRCARCGSQVVKTRPVIRRTLTDALATRALDKETT